MGKKDELYSIFKAIRSANSRYKTYPSNYADKLNKIMYRRQQGNKYKLQEGGAPTMQQFYDYGKPTPGLPYIFADGGTATPDMLASAQQTGQLPMMQMGQSFADSQMQDAARYGYMAKGGQALNGNSKFPNEKLGKFIGSVQGKAKAKLQQELMQAYDAPYSQQEVDQAMMQTLPRADWGGGFQQDPASMEGANLNYDELTRINNQFNQEAPDVKGSLGKFKDSFDNQYAKSITFSQLDNPYWTEASGTEELDNISKYAPETEQVFNPRYIDKQAYGGIPMYAPGGPFEKYKTSGNSMLELKSAADLNDLLNTVNQVMGMPGQYSMEDAELARQYYDLLQRDFKRLNQALSTKGQSVSINAPGNAQYTTGNSEWSVNNEKDPQGVYTWQNNSKAKPNVQVEGNRVITRGVSKGQPLAIKTGENSYQVNPAITQQQQQDAAAQQVQYPLAGYYGDSPVRIQSTTDANQAAAMSQKPPSTTKQRQVSTKQPVNNWRDNLTFAPDNEDEIANMVPSEIPIAPPVVGPQVPIDGQSEILYPGIDPVNGGFDPNTRKNAILLQDPTTGDYIYRAPDGTELGRSMDQNIASGYADAYFANQNASSASAPPSTVSTTNATPPSTTAGTATSTTATAGAPPASTDPTAGMTKEQRLEYWRKQRNLPEGTVMLPPAVAMSKEEKDRVIAEQKKEEAAKEQAPPATGSDAEKTTGTGTETKKEEAPAASTAPNALPTNAPVNYGPARIAAVETDYRWNPLGFMGGKDAKGNVVRDEQGRRVKRPGQVKHQRIEFGYGMPAVGPQAAPPAPVTPAAANTAPAANATVIPPVVTPTPEQLAAQAELDKKAAETPASPPLYNQARNLGAPPSKAYGGNLTRFVGGGPGGISYGVDNTGFNSDYYKQLAAQAGPAPEGMQNPQLITEVADYEYGRDWSGSLLTGMQALTDLKKRKDYNKEAAKLPEQLSASNIFKEQDNNDRGNYAANSGMLGIGNTTTGMRMSKYGGDENSEGNIYFLDEDTIRQIMAMGGTIEYLD